VCVGEREKVSVIHHVEKATLVPGESVRERFCEREEQKKKRSVMHYAEEAVLVPRRECLRESKRDKERKRE